ncbi:MAG: EAL domain-containing protein [Azoarcus sp.]|nr:EAL domain-containing protein [Azoarcus sp.]
MNHNKDESESRDRGACAVPADAWRVLVVDDEPEVFAITRLVLGRMQFRARPVLVEGVASAAEAHGYLERHPDTAIVLLDLVMETDDAGLRLVRHIREHAGLRQLQILVRTGHPAVAPEADVIAAYDINGYYLKTELTAQRLRSAITFALRNLEAAGIAPASASAKLVSGVEDETIRRALDELAQAIEQPPVIEPRVHLASGQISTYEVSIGPLPGIAPEAFSSALARLPESARLAWDRRVVAMLPDLFATLTENATATRLAFRMLSLGMGGEDGPQMFERLLDRTGLPPSRFELCVPERGLAGWSERCAALRKRGVILTLDGVGLGAMSLPDIQRLRPDIVALHPEIVCGVSDDVERAAIVRSVVALTHTLGAQSLARGVASNADIQFCKWEGCEFVQGPAVSPLVEYGGPAPSPRLH